jgi:hypothetical protein
MRFHNSLKDIAMVPAGKRPVNSGVQRKRINTLASIRRNPNPNSEVRLPKKMLSSEAESKATSARQQALRSGHYRTSDFGLLSGFGLRYSEFKAAARLSSSPDGPLLPRASRVLELRILLASGQVLPRERQPGHSPFAICYRRLAIGYSVPGRLASLLQDRSPANTQSAAFEMACTRLDGLFTHHASRITPAFLLSIFCFLLSLGVASQHLRLSAQGIFHRIRDLFSGPKGFCGPPIV